MLQVTVWQVYRRLHGGLTPRKLAVFLAGRNDAIGTIRRGASNAARLLLGDVRTINRSGASGAIRLFRPSHLPAIADGAEMLVDAEDDEHEFGADARDDDAHAGAEHAGDQKDHADERIERHGIERADDAGDAEQNANDDGEPIKDFDDRGRYEPVPLEQVADPEHAASPISK